MNESAPNIVSLNTDQPEWTLGMSMPFLRSPVFKKLLEIANNLAAPNSNQHDKAAWEELSKDVDSSIVQTLKGLIQENKQPEVLS